jgi:hypothetical protein
LEKRSEEREYEYKGKYNGHNYIQSKCNRSRWMAEEERLRNGVRGNSCEEEIQEG